MLDPEQFKKLFETRGKDPVAWYQYAFGLHQAARLLWARIDVANDERESEWLLSLGPVAMMLEGLAVEVLIKAILVLSNPQKFIRDGQWNLTGKRGHTLVDLVSEAGIAPAPTQERDLLQRLGEFVQWAGRYPIPREYGQWIPRAVGKRSLEMRPGMYYSTADREKVEALISRLEAELTQRMVDPGAPKGK